MTTDRPLSDFLTHLQSLDVRLALDGDRLTCNAPKGALTEEIKRELQARKLEILSFLRAASEDLTAAPIEVVERGSSHPLSFAQQRLWFLDRMAPGNSIYNITSTIRLAGRLDRIAFEGALREIIRRHESLRTEFREIDGVPRVTIGAADGWTMSAVSIAAVPDSERHEAMLRIARAEAQRPFELSKGPLIRATLIELGPRDHVVTIVMHHIVSDGWSLGIFGRDLAALYATFLGGQRPGPELPAAQYVDYVHWHRQWLERGGLDRQLAYWKDQLRGPLPVLELPVDRPRPAFLTHRGRSLPFRMSAEVTDQLKRFSRRENVTLFMTLLAGFKILLSRYAGQDDVIVGTPVANRGRPELAEIIGFFVNNLVLRTDLSGDPTVQEYLGRVRQVALDAFANQDVPFDRLVEVVRPDRSLNRSPLFQAMFILQNWPFQDLALEGLTADAVLHDVGTARFDLTLDTIEVANELRCGFEYNTDLFDPATIERMQGHYETILKGMVDLPSARISELPWLTPAESTRMVVEWNDTGARYRSDCRVDDLIEEQAARTPDAEAVRFGAVAVTYGELIRRANRLAHRLRAMGVGPETRVGIGVERSDEMVIAVLAVWKAGGAYVPLDPGYPKERLAFMVADAGLTVLITEASLQGAFPDLPGATLCLDREAAQIALEPDTPLPPAATAANLAYVIYTSGSTGKPKGVLIEHRSVVNFLVSMQREPGLTASDTLLSVTTLSFDIAGLELYLPLITGARVVLASRAETADGVALAHLMRSSGTTVMQATPATWRLLLDAGWRDGDGLTILCGGEALPRHLADGLLATGAEVWNLYGPTETTIWSLISRVEPGPEAIPIGRPIANTTVYVLDRNQRPVPANVPGELYIGGAGVARGYHQRPALTAERFVVSPFAADAGARLYRTGDQARYRADGVVEFLGRLDHQVKLRGFRIELGEIESVLVQHEAIRDAVVAIREVGPGDQRLVAYVVGTEDDALSARLRAWLSRALPQYMIPSGFVVLDAFPLTPNGKVDRQALARHGELPQRSTTPFAPPEAGLEQAVADIWRAVLRVERVGAHDNFFDLGGHSLLVVQLQAKLREQFHRDLPLIELFRRPTVSAMAEAIRGPTDQHPSVGDRVRDRARRQNLASVKE